jgi:hypothetical protein
MCCVSGSGAGESLPVRNYRMLREIGITCAQRYATAGSYDNHAAAATGAWRG